MQLGVVEEQRVGRRAVRVDVDDDPVVELGRQMHVEDVCSQSGTHVTVMSKLTVDTHSWMLVPDLVLPELPHCLAYLLSRLGALQVVVEVCVALGYAFK